MGDADTLCGVFSRMCKKAKTSTSTIFSHISVVSVKYMCYFLTSKELLSFRLTCKELLPIVPVVTVTAASTPSSTDVATASAVFVNATNMTSVQLGQAVMLERAPMASTVVIKKLHEMLASDDDTTIITQSLAGQDGTRVTLKVSCISAEYNRHIMAFMNHPRIEYVECREPANDYQELWFRSSGGGGWNQMKGPYMGGPYQDSMWGEPYSHRFCNVYDVMRMTKDDPELYKGADYWVDAFTRNDHTSLDSVCSALHRKHLVSQLEAHGQQTSLQETVDDLYRRVYALDGRNLDEELMELEYRYNYYDYYDE